MADARDKSNVNDEAVIDFLEGQVLRNRSPAEAFGELLFRNRLLHERELLSRATAAGINSVGEDWLRDQVGNEQLAAARLVADQYAALLHEHVNLDDPFAIYAPERAWHEWRSRHGR